MDKKDKFIAAGIYQRSLYQAQPFYQAKPFIAAGIYQAKPFYQRSLYQRNFSFSESSHIKPIKNERQYR